MTRVRQVSHCKTDSILEQKPVCALNDDHNWQRSIHHARKVVCQDLHSSSRSYACAAKVFSIPDPTGPGKYPKLAVCACRIAPILGPPSEPLLASVMMPNGAIGSVVPGVSDHTFRQPATNAFWLQAYPILAAELPLTPPMLFSPWYHTQPCVP
jgi:hypothetical protein